MAKVSWSGSTGLMKLANALTSSVFFTSTVAFQAMKALAWLAALE